MAFGVFQWEGRLGPMISGPTEYGINIGTVAKIAGNRRQPVCGNVQIARNNERWNIKK